MLLKKNHKEHGAVASCPLQRWWNWVRCKERSIKVCGWVVECGSGRRDGCSPVLLRVRSRPSPSLLFISFSFFPSPSVYPFLSSFSLPISPTSFPPLSPCISTSSSSSLSLCSHLLPSLSHPLYLSLPLPLSPSPPFPFTPPIPTFRPFPPPISPSQSLPLHPNSPSSTILFSP